MDRSLSAFIAIAEARNLTAAAGKIGLAQSSLTKKLRMIEKEYGGRLFERLPRGMELTSLGACLYAHAKKIERQYLWAREGVDALKSGHLATLRVGAGPTFHLLHISKIFERLRREFPKTQLWLAADLNDVTLPMLRNGELDIVVGQINPLDRDEELLVQPVTIVEHGAVARQGHALEQMGELRARDLTCFTWISYGTSAAADAIPIDFFRAHDLQPPEIAVYTTSFATGLQLVCSGDYLMSAPIQLKPIIEAAGARIHHIDPPIDRFEAGIHTRPTALKYPIVRRFAEILDQMFPA